jgi:hypothetical protein
MTWTTTEETAWRYESRGWSRPPWPKIVMQCDNDEDDDDITSVQSILFLHDVQFKWQIEHFSQ